MPKLSKIAKAAALSACAVLLTGAQGRIANLEQRVLASHNHERAALGIGALRWDADLARSAQDWADHLAASGRFEHAPVQHGELRQGENIWGGTRGAFTAEDMVQLWIAEKVNFAPGTFPQNSTTGRVEDVSHYTQLIWRRTGAVGCAVSEGAVEEIFVCRYSEAGNVRGRPPI